MAKIKTPAPWSEPPRKAARTSKPTAAPVADAPPYNLRLELDPVTLAKLRAVAEADGRPLRVMALRLLREALDDR